MKKLVILITTLTLCGCSLAPTYHKPVLAQPIKYKESGPWLRAKPHYATLERGAWWEIYHDSILNKLEQQVLLANQDLKAAIARYDVARTNVSIAKSDYFPTLSGVANATRQKTSQNTVNKLTPQLYNDFVVGINLNYELDVWGRVRNTVAATSHLATASAADIAFINLSLQTELATHYFNLRNADSAIHVLDKSVIAYQKSLYLIRKRYQGGASSAADVDLAQTQLETAKTLAADKHILRAQLEHAIAVLIGKPPALFSLAKAHTRNTFVLVVPYLPSTLLERRPDVAAAELSVQAANDYIGVARTAYFPAFNLTSAIGYDSTILSNLLKAPSLAWSLGPTLSSALLNTGSSPEITQTLIDGGRISALSDKARAQYDETVANYKQTVLNAYKDVEDSLIALRQLEREDDTQSNAAAAAKRALAQAIYRYQGGLTTYIDVAVVENMALQSELALVDVHARRQATSVQLIKALGGGWKPPSAGNG